MVSESNHPALNGEDLLIEGYTPVHTAEDLLRYYYPSAFRTSYGIRMDLRYGFWLTYEDEKDLVSVWGHGCYASGPLASFKSLLDEAGKTQGVRDIVAHVKRVFVHSP